MGFGKLELSDQEESERSGKSNESEESEKSGEEGWRLKFVFDNVQKTFYFPLFVT